MTFAWRASLALSLMAATSVALILGVVAGRDVAILWDNVGELQWLAQPPFWCLLAVWFGRRCGGAVPPTLLAATATTAAALGLGVLLAANGHGYLGPPWLLTRNVTTFRLMAVPSLLTVLAVGAVVRECRRRPAGDD
jgi:hypothetical protein